MRRLSTNVKSTGRRGAQLFIGKAFPPQVMQIVGDIGVARKFCMQFSLVKDQEQLLDLYSKRGSIYTKSALRPLITTYIANAKKAGDFAEPGNHHDRLIGPILEDIKRDNDAARLQIGQGFIEEREHQDFRSTPNAGMMSQNQHDSQQVNLWQAGPPIIQTIPPSPNLYSKTNNGRSNNKQDYGQSNGYNSSNYAQRQRTGSDSHFNTIQGRQEKQPQQFNQEQEGARLTRMADQFGGLRPEQGATPTSIGGIPNEYRHQDARSMNSGSAQSHRGEQALRAPNQFGPQGKTVEYETPDHSKNKLRTDLLKAMNIS